MGQQNLNTLQLAIRIRIRLEAITDTMDTTRVDGHPMAPAALSVSLKEALEWAKKIEAAISSAPLGAA